MEKIEKDTLPDRPTRVLSFANFFKNYMSVATIVTASLPIPLTYFKLIPTFKQNSGIYSIYTSLFCFLLLGYIFYSRHLITKFLYPRYYRKIAFKIESKSNTPTVGNLLGRVFIYCLPLILILLSTICALKYYSSLNYEVNYIRTSLNSNPTQAMFEFYFNLDTASKKNSIPDLDYILSNYQVSNSIITNSSLIFWYIGMFLCAEAAFILMAVKEYMQDVFKLSEEDIFKLS